MILVFGLLRQQAEDIVIAEIAGASAPWLI